MCIRDSFLSFLVELGPARRETAGFTPRAPRCTPAHALTAKSGAETPQRVSGMARASYRPFDDPVPWWLRVDVGERKRRAVCTRKVNESLQHTAHSRTSSNRTDLFAAAAAAAADRPNSSSSSSTQQRRRRGSGGGQLRASEPPIVRLMTPCLCGWALLGSYHVRSVTRSYV